MQQQTLDKADNAPSERQSKFLPSSDEGADILRRNREARRKEREAFIEDYFALDVRYNIK